MRTLYTFLSFLILPFSNIHGQTTDVTFRVDMSAETVAAAGVHIAGNFQSEAGLGDDWNPSSTPIDDVDGDDIYEITVSIPPGTYEYKFINGNTWGPAEIPPSECTVGPNNNRVVEVENSDLILDAVPFNGCLEKLRLAVNMTGLPVAPEGVYVMGDFQVAAGYAANWDPASVQLEDANRDGTYAVDLILPPGNYEFVFVNGNMESQAEDLPAECTVTGGNGLQVRTFSYVPGDDDPAVPCFNSCDECHPAVVYDVDLNWWNDAVFYEIFVRSFYDSDGDGVGDFKGIIEKLDYLNDGDPETTSDLGITGIWLMPMMNSPSYHGYDVIDYYETEPDYGTMADFQALLDAAHERGIKVIIDLVLNHSSSQNPWFQQSANDQNGYRDWYIWEDTNPGWIGPWGQPIWHQNGGDYFYGIFWSGMPDLNFEHPPVREEMFNVAEFWLGTGIDGYRLDAIKYLVEDGNVLENTPATFELLEEFDSVYESVNPDVLTVGEVWSSTPSIIPYVQEDRLDICFEFDLAGSILHAVQFGDPTAVLQKMKTIREVYPALQYAPFLTNHDMDRVFSVLSGNTDNMKLAAAIYLTLPGTPFVYYGEEVGMTGTGDHLNIRRPMQWSDGPHGGFTSGNPWYGLGSNFQTNNVEAMESDPNSLLRHYRRLIHIRNQQPALRRGRYLEVESSFSQVLSFARVYDEEAIVVVSNTGASPVNPMLSLGRSAFPSGEYYVTDLYGNQALGTITVDDQGGFSGWQSGGELLEGRQTWILLLSEESAVPVEEPAGEERALQLIPNPATGQFRIDWEGDARVRVFSVSGQPVYAGELQNGQLTVATYSWPSGVYFVRIFDREESRVGRLLVK